ncbi:PKD domain-containing protein [Fulvivirga kasyanovii]|nr:PKD domain-containing protein [Fulvivirga kasyanovii]
MAKHKYLEGEEKTKEKDRPDLAAAHDFEMTKDPSLGYPPVERKIRAFKTTRGLLEKKRINAKAIANVKWNERGPNNVGGRTRALMYDPNDVSGKKVWAGAVAGGIWFINDITDPSAQWQNVDDFMSNIAISTIAYDPQSTSTFYAGTGLIFTGDVRGGGIWKSEDSGATWNQLISTDLETTDEFEYTQKIVITSTSKIIAGTSSGIQVSTDGGTSWTNTLNQTITDVELASDGTVYASNYGGDIYKSTDGAETWSTILSESGYRVELAAAPSDPNTIYAVSESTEGISVGYFKKTTNGGTSWTDLTIPKYYSQSCSESTSDFTRGQAFFDLILGVFPDDPNKVIVGGIDLHRSVDGGNTWKLLSYWTGSCADYVHADQHAMVFKDGTTALFGNDGGVYYSDNLDEATPEFEERVNGYNTALFYSCAATNEKLSNTYLAGAQDNGMQMFKKVSINSTLEVTGGDGAFSFIDQDEPNIMISSYVYNVYFRSLDGGSSFIRFNDDQDNGRFINPCDYDDKANVLYAAHGNNAMVVYSGIAETDVKTSVKNISVGGGRLTHLRVSPYTTDRVFVGNSSGGVYRIDNAQEKPVVTDIDANSLPAGGYISCIEVGASDNHLLITISNYGLTSVWETSNGGKTWVNKEGNLPDMPIRWALYNPQNRKEVLLATEFGIWSTDDITAKSPEWEPTVQGLANVKCNMLQYRTADRQVVVATFGRGLFTTNVFSNETYIDFSVDKTLTYIGKEIKFEGFDTGDFNDYVWDFGDGNTSTSKAPTHVYNTPGTYTVKLSAGNGLKQRVKTDLITIIPDRDSDYSLAEGGNFDDFTGDFVAENIRGTGFERGNSTIAGKDGTSSGNNAWVTGIASAQYTDNSLAHLYTPNFDFSTVGTYELSFKTKYKFEDTWDGFIVEYSLDSGSTWTKLNNVKADGWYTTISDVNSVFGPQVPFFSGTTDGSFLTKNTDVSFLSGNERVAFRFTFVTDGASVDIGMALDDFTLSAPVTNAIADFTSSPASVNLCEAAEITFYDKSIGTISSYSWNFGAGASPATATGRGPHKVTYSTSGTKDVILTVEGESNGTQNETKNSFITIETNNIQNKTVTASSNHCVNETGSVHIENTETGFTYQMFNASDNTPASAIIEGNGATLDFSTGVLLKTTNYYVEVKDLTSSCSLILTTQPEASVLAPTYSELSMGNTDVCTEESLNITVISSEENVIYTIYDITNSKVFSNEFIGTGEDLVLSSFPVTDTIQVKLMAELSDCSTQYDPFYIIPRPAPEDATITPEAGGALKASKGESFQWYLDGEAIAGGTKQILHPRVFGEYTVEVITNGCSSISSPYTPTILGIEDLLKSGELSVFPNPTSGVLNIKQDGRFSRITIYNLMGQVVLTKGIVFQNEVVMLSFLQPGQYILELTGKSESVKLNIQKHK